MVFALPTLALALTSMASAAAADPIIVPGTVGAIPLGSDDNVAQTADLNTTAEPPMVRSVFTGTFQLCGVDVLGGDITSAKASGPDACPRLCDNAPRRCDAATFTDYQGGTCFLKTFDLGIDAVRPSTNAVSFMRMQHTTDPSAVSFEVYTDVDMPGNNIGTLPGRALSDCSARCIEHGKCFAVTWTDFQGGTCWLKTRASAFVNTNGAMSVFVGRKGAGGVCP